MDDAYKLIVGFIVSVAILGSIGIIAVLGDMRARRRQQAQHQDMAREAALLGWEYQPDRDPGFQLTGCTRDGIRWRLRSDPGGAEEVPSRTVWSTNALSAPYVALYVTTRTQYKHYRSWLGRRTPPPMVQLFLESAREMIVTATQMYQDYMVLVTDEALGYQIFGSETQAAFTEWLRAWHLSKPSFSRFTVQVGGKDLSIETTCFLDSMATIRPLVELGQTLARSYRKAPMAKVPPLEQMLAIDDDDQLQAKMKVARAFQRREGKELTDEEARYMAQHFRPPLGTMILGGFFLLIIIAVVISLFHRLFSR